jgi:hypothetical protein
MSRWVELSFIEDCKTLHKYGLEEYYEKANNGLYEFLNPKLAYPYDEINMDDEQKMWKIEKQDFDPIMIVTLKKQGLDTRYWVLDFYFPGTEKGFARDKEAIKGKHYLDTVSKIVKDEVIPYFTRSDLDIMFFKAYTNDGAGIMRKNLFQRMIDQFIPKNKFNIEIKDTTFIIRKK